MPIVYEPRMDGKLSLRVSFREVVMMLRVLFFSSKFSAVPQVMSESHRFPTLPSCALELHLALSSAIPLLSLARHILSKSFYHGAYCARS